MRDRRASRPMFMMAAVSVPRSPCFRFISAITRQNASTLLNDISLVYCKKMMKLPDHGRRMLIAVTTRQHLFSPIHLYREFTHVLVTISTKIRCEPIMIWRLLVPSMLISHYNGEPSSFNHERSSPEQIVHSLQRENSFGHVPAASAALTAK